MERAEYDVLIAGTGPVGLIAGLDLAVAGFRIALVGPMASTSDARTTAVM
ncbi:MAG: FAD-dependent monooxygenase, partial [Aliihoeflea sp.]